MLLSRGLFIVMEYRVFHMFLPAHLPSVSSLMFSVGATTGPFPPEIYSYLAFQVVVILSFQTDLRLQGSPLLLALWLESSLASQHPRS